jgi:two-component system LytT family response regulator
MKVILIDDAPQARKLLKMMLAELFKEIKVVAEAKNAIEAFQAIKEFQPDLIFLDIEMPGKSGLQLLEELNTDMMSFETIFVTAYNQYAIQAFKLSAVDYLLKPFRKNELKLAVEKAINQNRIKTSSKKLAIILNNLKQDINQTLCIPLNYGNEYLGIDDIDYLEADGAYTHIYVKNKKHYTVSKNLKHYENILCTLPQFAKINRSVIINLSMVKTHRKEDRGIIVLLSEKRFKLSPIYLSEFKYKMSNISV